MLEVYVLLKLVKMCRDAVLGSQSLSRRTHLLPSPHLQLQSPPLSFFVSSLSLPPSLPPHFAPHPSSLMSGHVHALSLPLAQARHALTPSLGGR